MNKTELAEKIVSKDWDGFLSYAEEQLLGFTGIQPSKREIMASAREVLGEEVIRCFICGGTMWHRYRIREAWVCNKSTCKGEREYE